MKPIRLRHRAEINPPVPEIDQLSDDALVTFVPLEAVWSTGVDVARTRSKAEIESGYTRFREGDILVPKITPTFGADRSCIATNLLNGLACGTTELHTVRPGPDLDPRYASYLLSSRAFLQGGEAEMTGVAGQQRVPEAWLADLRIPIDSTDDQHVIADFLDAQTTRIDALIRKKQALDTVLAEQRSAITTLGVGGALTHAGALTAAPLQWLERCPPHWQFPMLKLVAELGTGHTPSRQHPEWWRDTMIPWVTTGEVAQMRDDRIEEIRETREKLSALGVANSSAVVHPAGTVVLSRTAASAGFSAIMAVDMATSQDVVTWTCGPLLHPRYLLLCLRAMRGDLLDRLAMGSTHKTIYMPDVQSIRVPLPPLDEQLAIVDVTWERLRKIDKLRDLLHVEEGLLAERRRALITAAVTGELKLNAVAT